MTLFTSFFKIFAAFSSFFRQRNVYLLRLIFIFLFFLFYSFKVFSQSFAIDLGGQEVSLINANRTLLVNKGNNGLSKESVWRYDNLITTGGITVYGKLTIVDMVNASLPVLDDETAGTGAPYRFQPQLTTTAAGGYVSFELEFFELYTNQNVYVSNYYMTGVDIDGVEFYEISGYSSYIIDATSVLVITPSTIVPNGTRFYAGNSGELSGITFDNTRAFIAKYPHPATKISFVIGANGVVSGRQFSTQFGSLGGVFTTIDTNYNPTPVLTIDKTATPAIFSPGNVSQYTIHVSNGGNTVANVSVTDALPSELSYITNSTSVFIPASTTSKTVKDEFTNAVYTAQDGVAGIWTTNWVDNDVSATSGSIYISGGKLNFANLAVGDQIVRTANLYPSGSSSKGVATLSFSYDLTNSSGLGTSQLLVQLSTDGTIYTTVGTLTGNSTGTFSYTLQDAQITSNTYLRFANSGTAWGSSTRIAKLDNVQISYSYNKPDVTRTNVPGSPGMLSDGSPSGSLVAAADAITLEPGVIMTVTFNVLVACNASGTKTNTATVNCTGLPAPVSATHTAPVGPVSNGATFCATGSVSLSASGAGANQVYLWYAAASGGTPLYTGNPFPTPSISSTTTYYVSLYNAGTGCESVRVPVTATYAAISGTGVITELTAKNGTGGTSYADSQSSVGFRLDGVTGATSYSWDVSSITAAGGSIAGTSGSTIYLNFNNAGENGSYSICCTPSNSCGAGTKKCITINITSPANYGISGNLYVDKDGSGGGTSIPPTSASKVDGTGIGIIGGQQMYAVLFDKAMTTPSGTGGVVTSQAIASDGSYSFYGLRSTASNYHVYISKTIVGIGTSLSSLSSSLPLGATFNGAKDNDNTNSLTGGSSTNGYLQNISATDPVNSNVNFGVLITNPTAVNDGPYTVLEDHTITNINVLANDSYVSGHSITASTVDLDPSIPGRQTSYSVQGKGVFQVDNAGLVTFTPLADYFGNGVTAYYTVEAEAGVVSNIGVITVNVTPVNDAPSFTKGADQVVCAGSGTQTISGWATLISVGPANEIGQLTTFVVAGNTNSGIFSATPTINQYGQLTYTPSSTAGTATITVTLQDDGGTANGGIDTSGSQTFVITVNDNSTLIQTSGASTNPQTSCINNLITPVTFAVGGAGTGASITSGSLPSGVTGTYNSGSKIFTISGTPGVAGTYNYTVTTSGGTCSQTSVSGSLIVQSVAATATISGTTSVCVNSSNPAVTFTGANGTAPYTFFYTVNGGSQQSITTTSGNSVTVAQTTTIAGSYVYSLSSVRDASSLICSNTQSGTVTITVNALPTIALAGSTASVCYSASSQTTTLAYSGTNNAPTTYSISWSGSPTNSFAVVTNAALGASPISITVPGGTTAGTYTGYLTVKNGNGCTSGSTSTFTVTVNALPTITLAGSAASVCYSASLQTTTLAYGGTTNAPTTYSISWNGSPSNSFAPVTNATLGVSPITISVPGGTTAGTYTGYLTVKNGNGCASGSTSTFTVTVNALPTSTYVLTPVSCYGGNDGKIVANGAGGTGSYYFSINNGGTYTPVPETTHTFPGLIADTYIIRVKDTNGCVSLP
jgi:hypothetical protein